MEGGRIDHAHHDTIAHRALDETVAFDEAIELAYQITNQQVRRRGTPPSCIPHNVYSYNIGGYEHATMFKGKGKRGELINILSQEKISMCIDNVYFLPPPQDTLIVVTADHAHTMSISGYPLRGQEIVGRYFACVCKER